MVRTISSMVKRGERKIENLGLPYVIWIRECELEILLMGQK